MSNSPQTPTTPSKALTTTELALRLGVSQKTIRRAIARRRLRALKFEREYRIEPDAAQEYIESLRTVKPEEVAA